MRIVKSIFQTIWTTITCIFSVFIGILSLLSAFVMFLMKGVKWLIFRIYLFKFKDEPSDISLKYSIWFKRLISAGIVIGLFYFVTELFSYAEKRDRIIFTSISIPDELKALGWNQDATVSLMLSHLEHVNGLVTGYPHNLPNEDFISSPAEEAIYIEVEGLGLAVSKLFEKLDVGHETKRVSGEIILSKGHLQFVLNSSGKQRVVIKERLTLDYYAYGMDNLLYQVALELVKFKDPLRLADYYLKTNRTQEALHTAVNFPANDAKTKSERWKLIGQAFNNIGEKESALKFLKKALAVDSANGSVQLALAWNYIQNGNFDKASEVLSEVNQSNSSEVLFAQLCAFEGLNREEDMLKVYARLIAIDSLKSEPFTNRFALSANNVLASHFAATERYDEAYTYWKKLRSFNVESAYRYANSNFLLSPTSVISNEAYGELIDSIILQGVQHPILLYSEAKRHFQKGDFVSSLQLFRKLLESHGEFEEVKVEIADCLHKLKKNKDAVALLNEAIASEPNFISAKTKLSEIYFEQFGYLSAEQLLMNSLDLHQFNPVTNNNLGLVNFSRGQFEMALINYNYAIRCNHGDWVAWNNIARIYGYLQLPREELSALNISRSIDSTNGYAPSRIDSILKYQKFTPYDLEYPLRLAYPTSPGHVLN